MTFPSSRTEIVPTGEAFRVKDPIRTAMATWATDGTTRNPGAGTASIRSARRARMEMKRQSCTAVRVRYVAVEPFASSQPSSAARSTHHTTTPSRGRTPLAGQRTGSRGPRSARRNACRFSAPVARTSTRRARLIAASVRVSRTGGSASVHTATTQRSSSGSAEEPGEMEAMWPSEPIPRSTRSNRGRRPNTARRIVS